jgi:general secretion pathway protein M
MIARALSDHPIRSLFTRSHALPLLGYAASVTGLIIIAWLALAGLASDYAEYAAATDLLDRLEGRKPTAQASSSGPGAAGSPFLEGPTVTVAGAALQQRVVAAVNAVGGNVLSSQIELQGTFSKDGYVSLSANCEIDQAVLQQLLYDLEAGMPFLFVDQLVVQAPQSGSDGGGGAVGLSGAAGGKMRVQIDVSGQWQVTK